MSRHDDEQEKKDGQDEPAPLDPRLARLLASAAAPRELPASLRSRLMVLPAAADDEDAQALRYERARAAGLAAAQSAAEPPAGEGSAGRAVASFIAAAASARHRRPATLPAGLHERLLAIGGAARKPLPFWLVDARFAAAACLVLTLVSTVLAPEASALLEGRKVEVRVVSRGEIRDRLAGGFAGGLSRFTAFAAAQARDAEAAVLAAFESGQQSWVSRAEALRDLCEEKLRQFRQKEPARRLAGEPSQQGKNDGNR